MNERLPFNGNVMTVRHATGWTFLEAELHPGHAPPVHLHRNEEEAFYLLSGSMRFKRGDDILELGPGDFVAVSAGVPHAFVVGPEGARTIQVATGTDLADFIREASGSEGIDEVSRAAERHDMVIVGPPLDDDSTQ